MLGRKKTIIKFVTYFSLIFLFFVFAFVLAQEERGLEVEYPEIEGIKPETIKIGLPEFIKYVYNFAILAAGLIILVALIIGGIKYLTSFGQATKLREAKEQISSAFFGIIILLSSYMILTIINPQLTVFHLPFLEPIEKVEVPPSSPLEPEEISLISLELPYGPSIEHGVWAKERRTKIENLAKENEDFLKQEIKTGEKVFDRISDLNKYLKSLTDQCVCEVLKALCTEPKDFCESIGCAGDPCPEEVRKEIDKVLSINQVKVKTLLDFQKIILDEKIELEKDLGVFGDIEQEILSCQEETKYLFTLNEHLNRLNFFREQGWKTETITLPNAPPSKANPLTFYCTIGGTIFDYPYFLTPEEAPEIPTELELPEIPGEVGVERISCPVEFPLGEIVDELRELAISLMINLEKLAKLHYEMVSAIEKMHELVSQCNDKNCKIECKCVYNPCYLLCPPIPCSFPCTSPCLQCIGGCTGVPCPRKKIEEISIKIKEIEDEIFLTLKEIKQIIPKASSLLIDKENPRNLDNVKKGVDFCYSPEVEEPTWVLLNCEAAIESYGPGNEIISDCHYHNFFCCTPFKELSFPGDVIPRPEGLVYRLPTEKYKILPTKDNCPEGWLCDDDVKFYNQYNDASQPLKEFLSCMRERLNNVQKEKRINSTIGRISSISDSKIYKGTCNWTQGPITVGGCSHVYEVKYGKERVSAHYGGTNCRYDKNSYAVDFGDEENAEYIIEAAKKCQPDAYIVFRTPGHYDHVHISIGGAYDCGGN